MSDDGEPMHIGDLPDELLNFVLGRLPLLDSIRAGAVCKRWRHNIIELGTARFRDGSAVQSFCPLIFMRNPAQQTWCGYDSASGRWEPLPPFDFGTLSVEYRPVAGNGKRLLGFKIFSEMSQVVVGNPHTGEWQRIPRSTDTWGEAGYVLLADSEGSEEFLIVAIREEQTETYNSKLDNEIWQRLRQRPPGGLQEATVEAIKSKLCATLCGGFLYCYCTNFLVSFDIQTEWWTDDRIPLPDHPSQRSFQLVECVGNLFAAIEKNGTITIWGLGTKRLSFSSLVVMPNNLYTTLCQNSKVLSKHSRGRNPQLKAVGHKHRIFLWRNAGRVNKNLNIVVFDILEKTWNELPHFDQSAFDDFEQSTVETASFEL